MTVQWIPNVYSGDTQLEGHKPLYLQPACNYMKKVDLQKKICSGNVNKLSVKKVFRYILFKADGKNFIP